MSIIENAFARHRDALEKTFQETMPAIEQGYELLLEAVKRRATIFSCGNGGSAADAQHFATEFVCKYKDNRAPYPAHALSTDSSAITAIGNDFGYDAVFSRQVEALGKEGDVLVAFTTSGGSKNVLEAMRAARAKNMQIIVMTGEKGKSLEADCVIAIPTMETARIQEMHELIYHAWCEALDASLTK